MPNGIDDQYAESSRNGHSRPNIVMIVCDQLRYDSTGLSGHGLVNTPNVCRIADRGVSFDRAFTAVPSCCPARQSLLTGRRAESLGALWNWDITLPVASIDPEVFTWTQALRDAGYRTGFFGKWHVSEHHDPTAFGFEQYVGLNEYVSYRKERYPDHASLRNWKGSVDPAALEDTRTHWLAAHAERFIREQDGDSPFLVRLDFSEPHVPSTPVARFAEKYRAQDIPPWPGFGDEFNEKPYIQRQQLVNWRVEDWSWHDWAPIVARYFAIIEQMDDAVGCVLDALEERGIMDDTVVVFTADHGDMTGSHGMVDKHYVMYDDVMRVPLAMCGPGVVRAEAPNTHIVTNVLDLGPTMLELCGVEADAQFHGRSLVRLLRGESPPDWRDAAVAGSNGQQFGLYTQRMIRTERWKYIWNPTDIDELYDLDQDPGELCNRIVTVSPAVLSDLRRRLYEELIRCGDGIVRGDWLTGQLLEGRKL